jgi:hypothetical protein
MACNRDIFTLPLAEELLYVQISAIIIGMTQRKVKKK